MFTNEEKKGNKFPIFQERFNKLRGELSQDDFAKKIGISRPTVGFYENGERLPDALVLKKIAESCNASIDWLLGLTDVETGNADDIAVEKQFGLSVNAIPILREYKENADIFKKYEHEPDPSEGYKKYGDELSKKYVQGSLAVGQLKMLNRIIEEEQTRGIIYNMFCYVFGKFARKETDPYPLHASDHHKGQLNGHIAVADKNTGRDILIPYEILNNMFLAQLQTSLAKLRDEASK